MLIDGVVAFVWLVYAFDVRRALQFAAAVIPSAFLVEYVGVTTGFPFGPYHYTGALVPSVLGRVPAPITVAWLLISLGSLAAAAATLPNHGRAAIVCTAAALATGLDLCIEPTATHIKAYWLWEQSGPYYGVPTINFVGWGVTAGLICALCARVLWADKPALPTLPVVPVALYWATVAMFAIIDAFRGYTAGAVIGAALACVAIMRVILSGRAAQASRSAGPSIPRSRASPSTRHSRESRRTPGR